MGAIDENNVTRCNDQFGGVSSSAEGGIPDNFQDVIHCTCTQEILQCLLGTINSFQTARIVMYGSQNVI